jgi:hypothetical protein
MLALGTLLLPAAAAFLKSVPVAPSLPAHAPRPVVLLRPESARTARAAVVASAEAEVAATPEVEEEAPAPALRKAGAIPHWWEEIVEVVEQGTVPGAALIAATALSLTLANLPATSAAWLGFWSMHIGPHIGAHALSVRAWVNEGLMAVFFFVVGLEIKQELRLGSLASVKKAILPCVAALGGMVTPMAVYLLCQAALGGGSLCALTVPMATDIAFAMGVLGPAEQLERATAVPADGCPCCCSELLLIRGGCCGCCCWCDSLVRLC